MISLTAHCIVNFNQRIYVIGGWNTRNSVYELRECGLIPLRLKLPRDYRVHRYGYDLDFDFNLCKVAPFTMIEFGFVARVTRHTHVIRMIKIGNISRKRIQSTHTPMDQWSQHLLKDWQSSVRNKPK